MSMESGITEQMHTCKGPQRYKTLVRTIKRFPLNPSSSNPLPDAMTTGPLQYWIQIAALFLFRQTNRDKLTVQLLIWTKRQETIFGIYHFDYPFWSQFCHMMTSIRSIKKIQLDKIFVLATNLSWYYVFVVGIRTGIKWRSVWTTSSVK